MVKISDRLQKIANMVRYPRVADIGTDHGLLPIYMAESAMVERVLATDVNLGPLERALTNIAAAGLEAKISTCLCDGLDGIVSGEYDTCIIAGMGGGLIVKIIEENLQTALAFKQLLLSPQRDAPYVRKFLHANGFAIKDEVVVLENGKFYNVLDCHPGNEPAYDEMGYLFGQILLDKKDEILLKFVMAEVAKTVAIMEGVDNDNPHRQKLQAYKSRCEEAAKRLS
jgi:tRNA (adenine22-N1)-methyltransferase